MGKRELFIIIGFLAIGAVAYQFTAPPVPDGEGFSVTRFVDGIRREVRGLPASVEVETTDALALSDAVTEIRIGGTSRGIEVIGEDRDDIGYTLKVSSNGPDDATAGTWARAVRLETDDLGFALGVRLDYPDEGSQRASMTLRVPARLTVRVEGRFVTIRGVSAVDLDNVIGDTTVGDVAGRISGAHRTGRLQIDGAGEVNLTLTSSRAEVSGVRGTVRLTARNGEATITGAGGEIEVDQTNLDLTLASPRGPIYVSGTGGEIRIVDPEAEVRVDTRRAEVELQMTRAVPATILTDADTIRLMLGEGAAVDLDAATTDGGDIQADDVGLTAETSDRTARLTHTFGTGPAARVSLRNSRGDIVIRRRQ